MNCNWPYRTFLSTLIILGLPAVVLSQPQWIALAPDMPAGQPSAIVLGSTETETTINEVTYPLFISEAERQGEQAAVLSFSAVRDVEEGHARLYKKAMDHLLRDEVSEYYVCGICGYTSDGVLPDQCPICGAESDAFRRID